MRDVTNELKLLRLHGMASAWTDLMAQETATTASSKWLVEHLLERHHDRELANVAEDVPRRALHQHRELKRLLDRRVGSHGLIGERVLTDALIDERRARDRREVREEAVEIQWVTPGQ